jgi:hypothetical protein
MKLEPGNSRLEFIRRLDEFTDLACGRHVRLSLYRCHGCGKEVKREPGHAKRVKSCGCLRAANVRLMGVRDYTGLTVGRLEISHLISIKFKAAVWAAKCLNCKEEVLVSPYNITEGTSPCRCRHRAAIKKEAHRRHRVNRAAKTRIHDLLLEMTNDNNDNDETHE